MAKAWLVFLWALLAPSAGFGRDTDFDQGVDIPALTDKLRQAASADAMGIKAVTAPQATRDCAVISFRYGDPSVSPPVVLRSHVFQTVCERYGGRDYCYDKLLRTVSKNIVIAFIGYRNMLPWETDAFGVCMQDDIVTADIITASHQYALRHTESAKEYRILAGARRKRRTEPDPMGILVGSFGPDSAPGSLNLVFKDKWAGQYSGAKEKTAIQITLKKVVARWFDPIILHKEIVLKPQESYELRLADYAQDFRQPLERGREYFVEWGFRRLGDISRSSYRKGGETPRVLLP